MPAIQSPSKVLVSGANGSIATWIIRNLLEHGYSVRGTIRSANKGGHLEEYFGSYGDKFEVAIVEDITKEGAFDEAMQSVDAIVHTASPVRVGSLQPDDIMGPAIHGTIGILQSALKFKQFIKRVVFTSSAGTILDECLDPLGVRTEDDWNVHFVEMFKQLGENASERAKYRASKTLAEKAAWDFMQEHGNETGWDLTVLNPSFVYGPVINEVTNPSSLNIIAGRYYGYVADPAKAEEAGNDFLAKMGSSWVDVRDLAEAHRLSLEIDEAGNERIIICAGCYKWQDFIDAANALDPLPRLSKPLPKGIPGAGSQYPPTQDILDNSKSKRILGLKYRSIEEMTKDTFADYEARGW